MENAKKAIHKSIDFINAYIATIIVSIAISIGFAVIGAIVAFVLGNANEALVFGKIVFLIIMYACLGLGIIISLAITINNDNVSIKSILAGRIAL